MRQCLKACNIIFFDIIFIAFIPIALLILALSYLAFTLFKISFFIPCSYLHMGLKMVVSHQLALSPHHVDHHHLQHQPRCMLVQDIMVHLLLTRVSWECQLGYPLGHRLTLMQVDLAPHRAMENLQGRFSQRLPSKISVHHLKIFTNLFSMHHMEGTVMVSSKSYGNEV